MLSLSFSLPLSLPLPLSLSLSLSLSLPLSPAWQWEFLDLPTNLDIDVRPVSQCSTAVHKERLYLASTNSCEEAFLIRTEDLTKWEVVHHPPGTQRCQGLVSNGDHLFFLSQPMDESQYSSGHPLFQFSEAEEDNMYPWIELPDQGHHIKRYFPALAAIGTSLFLLGGQVDEKSSAAVSQYCLERQQWMEVPEYYGLPQSYESQQQISIVFRDRLVLLGGGAMSADTQEFEGHGTMLTFEIVDGRPVFENLRRTPQDSAACGACRLFGTVAIAGGGTRYKRNYSREVYVLNQKQGSQEQWVKLPPLNKARGQTSLVYFKNHLLAFGGCNYTEYEDRWSPVVERLRIALAH